MVLIGWGLGPVAKTRTRTWCCQVSYNFDEQTMYLQIPVRGTSFRLVIDAVHLLSRIQTVDYAASCHRICHVVGSAE
eukprot:scaffold205960_cov27-Prasinocladus_malaysianus.AAC.1